MPTYSSEPGYAGARQIHDTDIAHAMVGHTTYLDMYDRKDNDEKLELYLSVEPTLKIFKNLEVCRDII